MRVSSNSAFAVPGYGVYKYDIRCAVWINDITEHCVTDEYIYDALGVSSYSSIHPKELVAILQRAAKDFKFKTLYSISSSLTDRPIFPQFPIPTTEESIMRKLNLTLFPIPPQEADPCDEESSDRPFTNAELADALARLLEFIDEQEVFEVRESHLTMHK